MAFPLFPIIQVFPCDVSKAGVLTLQQTAKVYGPFLQAIRTSRVLTAVSKNYAFFFTPPPFLILPSPGMKHDASGSKTMDAGSVTERERERDPLSWQQKKGTCRSDPNGNCVVMLSGWNCVFLMLILWVRAMLYQLQAMTYMGVPSIAKSFQLSLFAYSLSIHRCMFRPIS
jgi:hypothetical protein